MRQAGGMTTMARLALGGIAAVLLASSAPAAHAQTPVEVTPAGGAVTASTSDANVPAGAVDNNAATRWSGNGDGAWLQFDLGSARTVAFVTIAFFQGDTRSSTFDIQVSNGGGLWTTVFSGASSGTSLAGQTFDFPDTSARWVRYLGHGNSVNLWNSLTEVSLFAVPAGPTTEVDITPAAGGATASTNDGNGPANAVDKNLATRWSGDGNGAWLQLDLGAVRSVAFVKVAVYRGDTRQNSFEIQVSSGGGAWTAVFSGNSSGTTLAPETYDFTNVNARFVRYLGHGSNVGTFNSITEMEVWGAPCEDCEPPCTIPTGTSALWNNFVQAKQNGTEPTLPDFSYAGYHRSDDPIPTVAGPIFNVTDFGATPNNATFDEAGIQAAIDAAAAAGGGVVFFPAGQYLLSPSETATTTITITSSNIVLRGAGAGTGGTEIVMVNKRQGTTLFRVFPNNWNATTVANITANAAREQFWVTVDSTAQLAVGQWVIIRYQNPAYNSFYFNNMPLAPEWTRVVDDGVTIHEVHQIAELSGNRVRFREPTHFNIRTSGEQPRLERVNPLQEIGIENIRFTGRWDTYPEDFVHHKDWIHDSGWTILSMRQLVHSWVRNVEFRNVNQAIHTDTASFTTFDNVSYTGKKGHTSITGRRGYGVLVKDNNDTAAFHHGPGGGYTAVHTVFLRHRMQSGQRVDWHGGVPHASLFDSVQGGVLSGNGGPHANYPHHGRYMVMWNFNHRGSGSQAYDFWAMPRNGNTFALPIFAGFTSNQTVTFQSESTEVQVNESKGTPVTPASLFEAQLALRKCQP